MRFLTSSILRKLTILWTWDMAWKPISSISFESFTAFLMLIRYSLLSFYCIILFSTCSLSFMSMSLLLSMFSIINIFCLNNVSTESLNKRSFILLMLFCFCNTMHWLLYVSILSCRDLACCSLRNVLSFSFYCKSEMLCSFSMSFLAISERYLVNSSASFCCSLVNRMILVWRSCFSLKI